MNTDTPFDIYLNRMNKFLDEKGQVDEAMLLSMNPHYIHVLLQMVVTACDQNRNDDYYHGTLGVIASFLQRKF